MKQLSLDTLRTEIDAIDDEIHNLLMSRTELVTKIGKLKESAGNHTFSLRPAREAAIMRRLAAQHKGPFPLSALIKIWRELLSGTVRVQTPFSVAVCDGGDPVSYRVLVRDQFSGALVKSFSRPEEATAEVDSGTSAVAVVPLPARNSAGNAKTPFPGLPKWVGKAEKTKVSFLTLLPGLSIVGQVSRVRGRKLGFLFLIAVKSGHQEKKD